MNEEITELTRRYYELVNRDHHKDRDCHFYIQKVWSYGEPPYYRVEHHGYVNRLPQNLVDQKFTDSTSAHRALVDFLKMAIASEESRGPDDFW